MGHGTYCFLFPRGTDRVIIFEYLHTEIRTIKKKEYPGLFYEHSMSSRSDLDVFSTALLIIVHGALLVATVGYEDHIRQGIVSARDSTARVPPMF